MQNVLARLLIDTQLNAVKNFKHFRGFKRFRANHAVVRPASLEFTEDCNWGSDVSVTPAQTCFRDA